MSADKAPANAAEEENKNAADEENEEDTKKEESIYQDQLPNRVIVARNHPLSYYVDRARRILRMEKELYVSGRGNTISMACTLVEVLKRQQIAEVQSIATGMNVEPFFNASGDPRWSQPTSMITFTLVRGAFAEFVADYHQRKVIEIFENTDDENSGYLSFDQLGELKMEERFKANTEQLEKGEAFLKSFEKEKKVDLPNFIRYASIMIHPLLKDKVFKYVLEHEYGIVPIDRSAQKDTTNL